MKEPIAVLTRLNGNWRSRRPPNALLPASAGPVPRTKVSGGSIQIPWWRHPNPLVSEGIRRATLVDSTRVEYPWGSGDFAVWTAESDRRYRAGCACRREGYDQPSLPLGLKGIALGLGSRGFCSQSRASRLRAPSL